jgi:Retroviral aspartyl protease
MPTYDAGWFTPPAPLARVRLHRSDTGAEVTNVPMVLDTGADVSLIPRFCITPLDMLIDPDHRYELVGFDGHRSTVPVVRLELHLLGRLFRGQFLVIDQEWGIVGRNILNQIIIRLDGPRLVWDLHR